MSKRTNGSTTHLQNGATATKRKLTLLAKGADSKEKHEGFLTSAASFVVAHQIELPMTLISLISLLHVFHVPIARKFLYLSYETLPGSGQYDVGRDDIYFVAFWVLAFTAIREAIMWHVLRPFATWNGVPSKKLERFAEQGWSFLYYMVFWTLGMYIMYHSPHWFNTSYYWIDYPHKPIGQLAKWYYLVQFAFYVQQVFVLNIEARRKDYPAMLTHHFVTCILISSSYFTYFTRIGNAVLCTMDFSDIILPFAKLLNYLEMRTICDIMFGVFLVSWLVTRHILFGIIIWATYAEPERYMDMKWEPELGKYFTPFTRSVYLGLFILLQAVIIFWFFMIVRVALKVIRGTGAEDTRSDSEDDDPVESVQQAKYTNGKKHE